MFIPLSMAHRLLIILLRRDCLVYYPAEGAADDQRVERLMEGKKHSIEIKLGMLEEAILLGSDPTVLSYPTNR